LYFSEEELVVQSATRSLEPVSQTAENITVVTAADIERMNAHTLADVLNTVPGVEVGMTAGPGSASSTGILGSTSAHVTVILDGVVINDLWSLRAEIGNVPVQNIERIEIVKGPASSAWGSALGGVVNVITKTGRVVDQGGMLSGSYGNATFGDFRVEARGKEDRFGYYLSAGRLQSRDFTPNIELSNNTNAYAKLSYDLTDKTDIKFSFAYIKGKDEVPYPDEIDINPVQHLHATIILNTSLASNMDLAVSAWALNNYMNSRWITVSTGESSDHNAALTGHGASARFIWKTGQQTIVVGGEADEKETSVPPFVLNGAMRKQAIYVNDTIVFDKLTVIPGVRFEDTSTNGGFTAPSLGLTYALGKETIIRTSVARGFNIPGVAGSLVNTSYTDSYGNTVYWLPNPDLKMETVWSYQAGIESAAMKYLWLKLSLFRNDIRNLAVAQFTAPNTTQYVNFGRDRLEGVMLETKTMPIYNTSLLAAAEILTVKDLDTNETIAGQPVQVYDLGLKYDDKESLNALLQGRHVNWNLKDPSIQTCKTMILDLTVNKRIHQAKNTDVEVFASGHNLLNTKQIFTTSWPNPERWYEAGLRYNF
jgi:vitamin B12 transporter